MKPDRAKKLKALRDNPAASDNEKRVAQGLLDQAESPKRSDDSKFPRRKNPTRYFAFGAR